MVNVNTTGFKSGEVLTLSVVAGGRGSGVQPIRRESVSQNADEGGGGDTDLARQLVKLIETEMAYKADAKAVRVAEDMLGQLIDIVA